MHVVDSPGLMISSCQGCLKVTWLWEVTGRQKMAPTGNSDTFVVSYVLSLGSLFISLYSGLKLKSV